MIAVVHRLELNRKLQVSKSRKALLPSDFEIMLIR